MNKPLVSPPVADAAQSTRTPDEAREQARVYHEWMMGVAALAASQPLEIWTPMQFHRDGKLVGDVEWSDEEGCFFAHVYPETKSVSRYYETFERLCDAMAWVRNWKEP